MQHIARNHFAAEFAAIYRHEIYQHITITQAKGRPHHDGGSLGHRLDNGDTGHDRVARKMALKVGFIHRDILDAPGGCGAIDLNHFVDQQERIAMRQDALDQADIGLQDWRDFGVWRGVRHSIISPGDRLALPFTNNQSGHGQANGGRVRVGDPAQGRVQLPNPIHPQ